MGVVNYNFVAQIENSAIVEIGWSGVNIFVTLLYIIHSFQIKHFVLIHSFIPYRIDFNSQICMYYTIK